MGACCAQQRHTVRNRIQHPFQIGERFVRRKTQHVEPLAAEERFPLVVIVGLRLVLRPVEFNDELRIEAGEVRDVVPERVLPTELHTQLLGAQACPELALGVGHLAPQRTGVPLCSGSGLVLHSVWPPSLPSPRGGRSLRLLANQAK